MTSPADRTNSFRAVEQHSEGFEELADEFLPALCDVAGLVVGFEMLPEPPAEFRDSLVAMVGKGLVVDSGQDSAEADGAFAPAAVAHDIRYDGMNQTVVLFCF